jgi:probable rRNA maturation factor
MTTKKRHSVTVSQVPRRLAPSKKEDLPLHLSWDLVELKKRLFFVLDLLCEHPTSVHVQCLSALDMATLNWQFRGKDRATDVLSFVPHPSAAQLARASSTSASFVSDLGEIAVCIEVCAEQARRHRCSIAAEVERMLVHGLVHLKGLDHERSAPAFAVMSAVESALRRQLKKTFGEPDFCHFKNKGTARKGGVKR